MTRYPLYIFDLDGTLYRGDEAIEGAPETVRQLKTDGSEIRYLTNNSGQSREFFLAKLRHMGFPAEADEIYSSGIGSAKYLLSEGLHSIFAIGERGLVETLRSEGLTVVNAGNDELVTPEGDASDAVLVGICRQFSYPLLTAAMQRIRSGQRYVATNPDTTFPLEGGRLIPGAGSILAAVTACGGREPFVVGKPNPYLVSLVLEEAGIAPADALVVGDRVDTDLLSGEKAGCPSHLVLTGVTETPPPGQAFSPDLRGLL